MRFTSLPAIAMFVCVSMPAAAAPLTYTASLSGPAEAPPNASPGIGATMVVIDPVAHTLVVDVTFSGLTTPDNASHIHVINGPGDANTADTVGPVVTTTPAFPGFPLGVTSGTFHGSFSTLDPGIFRAGWITDSGSLANAEAALFAGITQGRAYLNIHTTQFSGGEIRGFLAPVPEPATLGLLGLGLGGLVTRRFKSHSRS